MCGYTEEEMLPLSGIQHYVFCPRQWALIHLDQCWRDNGLTTEGSLLHQNVDNPFSREKDKYGKFTIRGLRVSSASLGLSGTLDALEIIPWEGAPMEKRALLDSRSFTALPIEHKRGIPKISDCDRIQVAAQAYILEETWGIKIEQGAIFYWETRQREYFDITEDYRNKVVTLAEEMHSIFSSRRLPEAVRRSHCRKCSLVNECLPNIVHKTAGQYLRKMLLAADD